MNPITHRWAALLFAGILLASGGDPVSLSAEPPGTQAPFRAGAAAIEITPASVPRIIAGGFLEQQAAEVQSPLFARGFVLSDGQTKIAMVVVDTCMMPQRLIDEAKQLAGEQCDIPVDHMMVSATHTHAAPAAMSCLGTREDKPYSVSVWFRCETPNHVRPVTAYLLSRGPDGDGQAAGDHLGIGGNYRQDYIGKLLFFNGNRSNQAVVGPTVIEPQTWNHVVWVRDRNRITAWLNRQPQPEIDAEIDVTAADPQPFFLGARSDQFAPLQGQLAHFALFDRALTAEQAKQLHTASGQPAGTPEPSPEPQSPAAPQPSSQPLSPAEALQSIHVPEGFRIELVAAEPDVIDPVAFDWDSSGRLWVVEMADYPLGIDGKGKPGGRIRVLEDTDGDGRYDRSRLYADGLNFPTGILTWRDGVLVTAAPHIHRSCATTAGRSHRPRVHPAKKSTVPIA